MTHEPPSGPNADDPNTNDPNTNDPNTEQPNAGSTPPPPPPTTPPFPPPPPMPPSYGQYPQGAVPPPSGRGGYYDPGYQEPFSATAAISYGFTKFKANAGPWLLAMIIFFGIAVVLSVVTWPFVEPIPEEPASFGVVITGSYSFVEIIVNIVLTAIGYIFSALLIRGALDETEGIKFSITSAFSRIEIVPVVLLGLLLWVGTFIGIILCILPGIAFAIFTVFAMAVLLDRKVGVVEAVTESFRLVKEQFGNTLLLVLLMMVLSFVALILCCVPIIVAVPITQIATAYAYKKFTNQPVI